MKKLYLFIAILIWSFVTVGLMVEILSVLQENPRTWYVVAELTLIAAGMFTLSILELKWDSAVHAIAVSKIGLLVTGVGIMLLIEAVTGRRVTIYAVAISASVAMVGLLLFVPGILMSKPKRSAEEAKNSAEESGENQAPAGKKTYMCKLVSDDAALQTVWQYKQKGRVELSHRQKIFKRSILIVCVVGIVAGILMPIKMRENFDYEYWGNIGMLLASVSLVGLALTLGYFKSYSTVNIAFVRCDDGSVFLIDFFDVELAKQYDYYEELPSPVKNGIVYHSGKMGGVQNLMDHIGNTAEARKCYSRIHKRGLDKLITARFRTTGHQIVAVPEIAKGSLNTRIRFLIWKDGRAVEYENRYNLYDNCYEGYEEMVSYFSTAFDHWPEVLTKGKSRKLRILAQVGCVAVSLGLITWIAGIALENAAVVGVGIILFIFGLGPLVGGLDGLRFHEL